MRVKAVVKEHLSGCVLECGCGNPTGHLPLPCPTPKIIELGDMRFWALRHPFIWLRAWYKEFLRRINNVNTQQMG